MPPRLKEEERIEKIIRGFLKQPQNRRCMNCNSLGPQYVCTTFWTFICTNCSGMHREFTHRVKSVSMAKFNAEEVGALQDGGNERARQIYLKTWDSQCNFYPDGSNLQKLREFIRHVYVEQKYMGKPNDKPSTIKPDQRNRSSDLLPVERSNLERCSFEIASRCAFDESYDRRSFEKSCLIAGIDKSFNKCEDMSPRYIQANARFGGNKSRSTLFEVVDDRFRDDGNVKHYRYGNKETRYKSSSPTSQKSREITLPAIRPVKDILGDIVPPLKIGPKVNEEESARNQNNKATVSLGSLIDFDANPETREQLKETSNCNECSSTALENSDIAIHAPQRITVESLLFELSVPVTSDSLAASKNQAESESSAETLVLVNSPVSSDDRSGKAPEVPNSVETRFDQNMNKDQTINNFSRDSFDQIRVSHPQKDSFTLLNDTQTVSNVSLDRLFQANKSENGLTPKERKELPADLFSSNFNASTPAVPSWQVQLPHGMSYGMQNQPPPSSTMAYSNTSKPSNPFDIGSDGPQVQAEMFPTMSMAQEFLPSIQSGASLQLQPPPYSTTSATHFSPYRANMVPEIGQPPNRFSYPRSELADVGFGSNNSPSESFNPIHHSNRDESFQAEQNTPSNRVNPFG